MRINATTLFKNTVLGNSNKTENQTKNYTTELASTNHCDKFTFKGSRVSKVLTPRFLPEDLVASANKVLEHCRKLNVPSDEASSVLSSTKSTPQEREAALEVLSRKIEYKTTVEIDGSKQPAEADLGQYFNGWALCIKSGKGANIRNYRIMIDKNNKISNASEIMVQKNGKDGYPSSFISLKDQNIYEQTVLNLRTLLGSFSGKAQ